MGLRGNRTIAVGSAAAFSAPVRREPRRIGPRAARCVGHADPLRHMDGRRPRRQSERHRHSHARSVDAGALDGRRSVPARCRRAARFAVDDACKRRVDATRAELARTVSRGAEGSARTTSSHARLGRGTERAAASRSIADLFRRRGSARTAGDVSSLAARMRDGADRQRSAARYVTPRRCVRHHAGPPRRTAEFRSAHAGARRDHAVPRHPARRSQLRRVVREAAPGISVGGAGRPAAVVPRFVASL